MCFALVNTPLLPEAIDDVNPRPSTCLRSLVEQFSANKKHATERVPVIPCKRLAAEHPGEENPSKKKKQTHSESSTPAQIEPSKEHTTSSEVFAAAQQTELSYEVAQNAASTEITLTGTEQDDWQTRYYSFRASVRQVAKRQKSENAQLAAQNELLSVETKDLKAQLAEEEREHDEELEGLRVQLRYAGRKLEQLDEANLKHARQVYKDFRQSLGADFQKKATALDDKYTAQLLSKDKKVAVKEKKHSEQLEALKQKLKAAEDALRMTKREEKTLKDQHKKEIKELKLEHSKANKKLMDDLSQMESQIQDLKERYKESDHKVLQLSRSLSEARHRKAEVGDMIPALNLRIHDLESQRAKAANQILELEEAIEKLKEAHRVEIQTVQEHHDRRWDIQFGLAETRAKDLIATQRVLKVATSKSERLEKELEELKPRLKALKDENQCLRDGQQAFEARGDNPTDDCLVKKVEELRTELKAAEEKLSQSRAQAGQTGADSGKLLQNADGTGAKNEHPDMDRKPDATGNQSSDSGADMEIDSDSVE